MRHRAGRLAGLLAAAAIAACTESPPVSVAPATAPPVEAPATAPPTGPTPFDPATATAILEVRTLLRGDPPRMRHIRFDMDAECVKLNPVPVPEPTVVVRDGRLANIIVWVSKGAERWTYEVPTEPIGLEVEKCMFVPHVFSLQIGQALSVAADQHTGHTYTVLSNRGPRVEKDVLLRGPPLVTRFAREELGLRVMCIPHGWMRAVGGVFAHPFHAVTDDRGEAFLRLPPGDYEVSVWHEYDKFATPAPRTVKVAANGTAEVEFVFETR